MPHRSRTHLPLLLAVALAATACASAPEGPGIEAVFFPPPPNEPRFQLLATFNGAEELGDRDRGLATMLLGSDEDPRAWRLTRPFGLAWHGNSLYVVDADVNRVAVLDFATKGFRWVDPRQKAPLAKPIEIAIAPDGRKYVTDTKHRRVIVYGPDDEYETAFGDPDGWKPTGIALDGDRLYVTDLKEHSIRVLDRNTGEEIDRFGERGNGEGTFNFPAAIAVGPGGDLFVNDSLNCGIQRFRSDGTWVQTYGRPGRGPGQFSRPKCVDVDPEGRFYVTDVAFENVQIFDENGKLLLYLGGAGPEPGQLNVPSGVLVSKDAVAHFRDHVAPGYRLRYVLFVASQFGSHRVTAYGFLER